MNKFAKGSLAAGAGLVLLLGGAGTLAYWNDSEHLDGGTINTGSLTLDQPTDAESGWDQEIEIWVPGDKATYTTTLTLEAEGDNIQGNIVLDPSSIVFTGGKDATEAELAEQFDVEVEFGTATITGGEGDLTPGDDTVVSTFDSGTFDGPGTYKIPVSVTVEMPFSDPDDPDTANNSAQGAEINFSELSFTATQTQAN